MAAPETTIRTFNDYEPYTYDNGKYVENPEYSYWGSEPPNFLVDPHTLLLHSMYVPADKSPTDQDSFDPYHCKNLLEDEDASCHFLIPRLAQDKGRYIVYQMVETDLPDYPGKGRKAWHAGVSKLPQSDENEPGLNHSSIGIELIGAPDTTFTGHQYKALVGLVVQLLGKYPTIENILGHNEVSGVGVRPVGEEKNDPEKFHWDFFIVLLSISMREEADNVKKKYRKRVL